MNKNKFEKELRRKTSPRTEELLNATRFSESNEMEF